MDPIVAHDVWKRIETRVGRSRVRMAAVAYLGVTPPLPFAKGGALVVDASDKAIRNGSTSAEALMSLLDEDVLVYSLQGLHAKIFVAGRTAFIGSANFSGNSAKLLEAVYVTDDRWLVAETERIIGTFRDRAEANRRRLGDRTTDGLIGKERLAVIKDIKPMKPDRPRAHDASAFDAAAPSTRVWLSITSDDDTEWTPAAERAVKQKEAAVRRALGGGYVSETDRIEQRDLAIARRYRAGDTVIRLHYYGEKKADVRGPCQVTEGVYRADNMWAQSYAYRRQAAIRASDVKRLFCEVTGRTDFPRRDTLLRPKEGAEFLRRFVQRFGG